MSFLLNSFGWQAGADGGLLTVIHDNSLFGDGTVGLPLGVSGSYHVLWVSPDGSDITGTRGRQTLPFLTIQAAKTAALVGDLIYVSAGSYTDTAIQKNGVFYYFEMGAVVNSTGKIWDTEFVAASFRVRGYGRFVSTLFPIVSNTASDVDIECDSIISDNIAILVFAGTFRLRFRFISSVLQYGMSFRGTSTVDVEGQTLDCSTTTLQSAAIFIFNHSIDLVPRTVRIKITQILSNANGSFGAISVNNSPDCTIILNSNITHVPTAAQTSLGGMFVFVNAAKLIFNGNAITTDSYGVTFLTTGAIVQNFEFQSGLIKSNLVCVRNGGGSLSYFKQFEQAVLNTTGDVPVVELGGGGYVGSKVFANFESWGLIKNTFAGAPTVSHGIRKEGAAPNDTVCRLNGCKIIVPSQSINTAGALAQNVQIMSCYSNAVVTPALIVNIIAGTAMIVDAGLTDNPIIS
jgi:hypothetical protein